MLNYYNPRHITLYSKYILKTLKIKIFEKM